MVVSKESFSGFLKTISPGLSINTHQLIQVYQCFHLLSKHIVNLQI